MPIKAAGEKTAKLVKGAQLITIRDGPHAAICRVITCGKQIIDAAEIMQNSSKRAQTAARGSRHLRQRSSQAKLFHRSDCRKRPYVIGSAIAKAMRAKSDCCYCPQFFVVEPAESNGNVVAPRLVTVNHGCV